MDNHTTNCQLALVACPNKCKDSDGIESLCVMRKDLADHLIECPNRDYSCPHCGEKGIFAKISENHEATCPKKRVDCPNKEKGCQISVELGISKYHVFGDCDFTEVACVYESLGCGVKMLRKDLEKHKRKARERHLDMALDAASSQQEHNKTLSVGEGFVFKLPGFSSKRKKGERIYSAPFYTHQGGYKLGIIVDPNGNGDGEDTHVSIFTKLLAGQYDGLLHWPFVGTVTYELLNQLEDDKHHSIINTFPPNKDIQVGSTRGFPKFLPHSSLGHDPATSTQYLLDDTLYFRVTVKVDNHKPWLVCFDKVNIDMSNAVKLCQILNENKPLVFKITDFSAKKEKENWFQCEPFYTGPGGYRMCIVVVTNGEDSGKGSHLTVYSKLLEGSHDASLSWPFKGSVIVTLLNHLSDYNHYVKGIDYTDNEFARVGKCWGYQQYIPHSALSYDSTMNTQFLMNDMLYFKVSVNTEGAKHWLTCTLH